MRVANDFPLPFLQLFPCLFSLSPLPTAAHTMLMLPYKRFPFSFNGDFTVAGQMTAERTSATVTLSHTSRDQAAPFCCSRQSTPEAAVRLRCVGQRRDQGVFF